MTEREYREHARRDIERHAAEAREIQRRINEVLDRIEARQQGREAPCRG